MGVLGLAVYTKVIYKRPVITESSERERLSALHASPTPPPKPGLITFEPVTINIQSVPHAPKPADSQARQIEGKLHYLTVGFALEIKNMSMKDQVENLRPVIMDQLLAIVGRKAFNELTTVQGRYVLRAQILETVNRIITKEPATKNPVVTNVFFNQFIVQ
jgi:hypothetical protein